MPTGRFFKIEDQWYDVARLTRVHLLGEHPTSLNLWFDWMRPGEEPVNVTGAPADVLWDWVQAQRMAP